MLTESGLFRAESQLQNRVPGFPGLDVSSQPWMVDSCSIKVLYYAPDVTNVSPRPWTSSNFLPSNFSLDTPNYLDFSSLNWYSPIAHAQLAVTRTWPYHVPLLRSSVCNTTQVPFCPPPFVVQRCFRVSFADRRLH